MFATNCLEPKEYVERLNKIRALGFYTIVGLSIMGIGNVHDYYRGIKGNYDKVIEMARLLQGKHTFYFSYTRMPMSQDKWVKTLACSFNTKLKISNFRYDGRFNTKGENKDKLVFDCPGLKTILGIHPNGNVSACDHFYPELVVGNLYKQRLEDMYFDGVRQYIEQGRCQPCPIKCWEEHGKV
jgi:sulfatase maturation enzyme AslB (radical SAM superfamily)